MPYGKNIAHNFYTSDHFNVVNVLINFSLRWNFTHSCSSSSANENIIRSFFDDRSTHKQRTYKGRLLIARGYIVYLVTLGKRITGNTMRHGEQRPNWFIAILLPIQLHRIRLIVTDWNGSSDSNCYVASNLSTPISFVWKRKQLENRKNRGKSLCNWNVKESKWNERI